MSSSLLVIGRLSLASRVSRVADAISKDAKGSFGLGETGRIVYFADALLRASFPQVEPTI